MTATALRPPVPYFGGKQMLAQRIIAHFPAHVHYVEPFCGSLAVLLAKPPSKMETVNDLDGDLINFWRVLRDQAEEFVARCEATPHSRQEHADSFDLTDCDDIERARRVWVQLTQGRSARRTRTGWRNDEGPNVGISMTSYLRGYLNRLGPAAERLRRVSLESRPAVDLIRSVGKHPEVLIYADPPYVGSTREGSASTYAVEMAAEDQHRAMADALHEAKASVVLSGYASPLYEAMFDGWRRAEIPASTAQGGQRAERTEVLWFNFDADDCLDFGAVG